MTQAFFAHRRALRHASLGVAALLTLSLSACSLLTGPTPPQPPRQQAQLVTEAQYIEGGSASENEPIFLKTLQEAAETEETITSAWLAEQFTDVGFDEHDLHVSHDATRTDLEVESMFIAAHLGEECLIGQIGTKERDVTAQVMPAVGPDAQVCLLGETAPLHP